MAEFLKSLLIKKAILIGHSFGSRVALVFAGVYPQMVEKLVLITPVVKVEGLVARFVSVEYKIAEMLPEYLRKAWLSNKIHSTVRDTIIFRSSSLKKKKGIDCQRKKEAKILNPDINIELFAEFYKFNLASDGKKVNQNH